MNAFIFVITAFLVFGCSAQQNDVDIIVGDWKSVKLIDRGYQKFSRIEAEKLYESTLTITHNKFNFKDIDFVEPCVFEKWKVENYDTTEYLGYSIEFLYSKKELSKLLKIIPVDENGELSCYNECSAFFLKEDTLINICGGYTLYLLREPKTRQFFSGIGNRKEEIKLSGSNKLLELEYDFYSAEDQLILKDESGTILFDSNMITTNGALNKKINVEKLNKVYIEIKSSSDTSKWKVKVSAY